MKNILVDAVNGLVVETENGFEIFEPIQKMLDEFPNTKIILTGADDEQFKKFGLDKMPYEVFTLKHDPEKTNPEYYKKMLEHFNLGSEDVIYFEHNLEAVRSAESVGIKSYHYDHQERNLKALETFFRNNV
jgi:FMN phosphatase YigB (HAD superfamily)